MASTWNLFCMVVCLFLTFHSALSIKCRKCYPPMPEDDCKRSDEIIDCRAFAPLGYTACIQVEYSGNNTIARTCYQEFMCEGAIEWCRRYGPCTATCCKEELCNSSNVMQVAALMPVLVAMATLVW